MTLKIPNHTKNLDLKLRYRNWNVYADYVQNVKDCVQNLGFYEMTPP